MKLLVFIYNLHGGGAERVTVNLVNHWAEKGWQLTVVTMVGPGTDFYTLNYRVKRISLNLDADSHNPISALKHNLKRVLALRQILKQETPDVALSIMTSANCLLALAGYRTGIPLIGSERIYPPLMPIDKAWNWLRRKTYPMLDVVVSLTQKSAVWIEKNTGARHVRIIPNAVFFPLPDNEPKILPERMSENKMLVIAVGRLHPQKGFDRLINAFGKAADRISGWRLVILGEGPERQYLESLVKRLNLDSLVTLPGAAGNIADWYKAAELFVLGSHFEGFPNVLIEAMAHGLPVISVDCDTGPRDIIRNGKDGLLVPQDDEEALVKALVRLMKDGEFRATLAANAIEVRQRFSVEKVDALWEELFCEVIKHD